MKERLAVWRRAVARLAVGTLVGFVLGCGPAHFRVVHPGSGSRPIEVRRLVLPSSNVYLVRGGAGAVLVDT